MCEKEKLLTCLANARNEFPGEENTEELYNTVKEVIPLKDGFKIDNVSGTVDKFKATLSCTLSSGEEVDEFVNRYMIKSKETLRKLTPRILGEKNLFTKSIQFRCHHRGNYHPTMNPLDVKRLKPSKRIKNTNCPFSMIIKLSKSINTIPSLVEIEMNHNHPTQALQVLTFRDIDKNVSDSIRTMFEMDYTPARAYKEFLKNVEKLRISDEDYQKVIADRSLVPRKKDFNNMFTEYKQEKFGSKDLSSMFQVLTSSTESLKEGNSNYRIKFQPYNQDERDPFILILISPLMTRVHEMVRIKFLITITFSIILHI